MSVSPLARGAGSGDFLPLAPADCTRFAFTPAEYRIKPVSEAWERAACACLRRVVFCDEQRLFDGDDADDIDRDALTLAAVACIAGMGEQVVGTVRIHRAADAGDEQPWWGSRLAVQREYRGIAWLGSELIRLAVGSARARGCTRFLAQVQVQNVALFERLHWQALAAIEVRGRPHCLMQAQLDRYPCAAPDAVFTTLWREAA